ncbi:MAG: site-specific DNA-methyltransferase [Desulfovibrio sp.]|jgi:site-specific DNA-methyltransferase (adenine-specific)|nr:site-specific DNA-methyltransferase [Desulfovibrio sp.]
MSTVTDILAPPMRPRMVQIGNATLYCGDCYDILPCLGQKIDVVVCDPPYNSHFDGSGIGSKRHIYRQIRENKNIGGSWDYSLLNSFKNWLCFCNFSQAQDLFAVAKSLGLRYQLRTWNKPNPTPLTNGNYLPDTEYQVHAFIKHDYPNKHKYFVYKNNRPKELSNLHPTLKPLAVMIDAIQACSIVGDTILDPFMGSGTTGVAALELGRAFVGIEIDPKYFDTSCRRVADASSSLRLFAPALKTERQMPLVME